MTLHTDVQASGVMVRVSDGMIVVAATGRIDRPAAATLRDELARVWPICAGILAVDLSACTYLSLDAIRILQDTWRRPSRARGELRVIAGHPDVMEALDAANIPRVRT